ncbi:MAG: RNA polymerase sigma factor [Bacillota bacterium]|nr:RNA polymerase sigma factor [Bacillota bacterium]
MFLFLMAQLDDNDREFMLKIYKNYYSYARKTIYNLTHNNDNIEDLIDDVFVKLIEKISVIRTLSSCKLTSYVVSTVRSVSINYIKHRNVENKYTFYSDDIDLAEGMLNNIEDDSEERLIREDEIESLSDAVSKLPQNQQDLLYFKYILEMSDEDIAEKFGIGSDSVRQYLTRARRNAKKLMKKETSNYAGQ